MATFRIFLLDGTALDVTLEGDILKRGGSFVAMDQDVVVGLWPTDLVSFVQRLDPLPTATRFYRLTYRDDRPDDTFPANGIRLDEDDDWITGWDGITIGWVRRSNLASAVLIQASEGVEPPVVQQVGTEPEPEPVPAPEPEPAPVQAAPKTVRKRTSRKKAS